MLTQVVDWIFAPITCYESAVCGALGFLCGSAWFAVRYLGRIAVTLERSDGDVRANRRGDLH